MTELEGEAWLQDLTQAQCLGLDTGRLELGLLLPSLSRASWVILGTASLL
jgi:hypothetical protein